jgi:outer membrane protein OmpA-like peptidoglycan-associated protein
MVVTVAHRVAMVAGAGLVVACGSSGASHYPSRPIEEAPYVSSTPNRALDQVRENDGAADAPISSCHEFYILVPLRFRPGSSTISKDQESVVNELADIMAKEAAHLERLAVIGQASIDEHDGAALSEARAAAVMSGLLARHVDARRLEAHGAGLSEAYRVRSENRRVDFFIARWDGKDVRRWNGREMAVVR